MLLLKEKSLQKEGHLLRTERRAVQRTSIGRCLTRLRENWGEIGTVLIAFLIFAWYYASTQM